MNKNASTSTNVVTYQVKSSSKASKARSFLSALCWMSNSDDASTNMDKKIIPTKAKIETWIALDQNVWGRYGFSQNLSPFKF